MNSINNTPQAALKKIEKCRKAKSDSLDLSDLGLTEIPKEIADLTWLKRLFLNDNEIKKIEGLNTLTNLTDLWLSENQIEKIEGLSTLTWPSFAAHKNLLTLC